MNTSILDPRDLIPTELHTINSECRRVLIAAAPPETERLSELFYDLSLQDWETLEAGSPEQARYILQNDPCNAVLLDESLAYQDDLDSVTCMAAQCDTPVILLAEPTLEMITYTMERGIQQLLPRDQAFHQPALLAAALNQAVRWSQLQKRDTSVRAALSESRLHIDQLMSLLWETTPIDGRTRWLTQRYMIERLVEEIARSQRHGTPLAVALGELRMGHNEEFAPSDSPQLTTWTAEQICLAKRRSDVAGQYGPDRFMLIMVQTTEFGAVKCCQRLKHFLEREVQPPSGMAGPVTVHFGLANYSPTTSTSQSLLDFAEQRLEEARAMDTGRVAC